MPRRPDLSGSDYAAVAASVSRTIGQHVAAARAELGMSQIDVGAAMARTGQWIAEVETGRIVPRVDLLAALAAALGTTVGALLGENTSDAAALERALPGWRVLDTKARANVRETVARFAAAAAPAPRRAAEESADYEPAPRVPRGTAKAPDAEPRRRARRA